MRYSLQPSRGDGASSSLLVAELLHRTRNDYARIISFASLISARSGDDRTKVALREITDRLRNAAETQRLLSPPVRSGTSEFAETLAGLCNVISASLEMEQRGISLALTVDDLVFVDAERSWLACLIIFELISNACRHAFIDHRGGRISVAVTIACGVVICRVSDDGRSSPTFVRGLGTTLVDALVTDLDGFVERQFTEDGTVVTLSFAAQPSRCNCCSRGDEEAIVARPRAHG
jgi:two-component sensor histidine kinase